MILVLALLALAAATASYAYAVPVPYIDPLNDPTLLTVSWILCPPLLFFGWDGFIVSAIIEVLNAGLYGLIGLMIVTLKKEKRDNSLRIDG
jgi:hypothetical protein